MHFSKGLLTAALALTLSTSGVPQQTSAPPRDPQALEALQSAIDAMGGTKAIAQIQAAVVQGSIAPASGVNSLSGSVVMEDVFTSKGHEFKDLFRSSSLTQSFVSGHGSPGILSNGRTRRLLPQVASARLAVHLPAIVLAGMLSNPNYTISFVGTTTLDGRSVSRIHIEDDSDLVQQTISAQDWYFDPSSRLPLRIEYRVPDTTNLSIFTNVAVQLADYQVVQGIATPFQISGSVEGKPQNILSISSVAFNQVVTASDFDLPAGVAQ